MADKGALSRENGDLLQEYQALHEEKFISSRLREDVEGNVDERDTLN